MKTYIVTIQTLINSEIIVKANSKEEVELNLSNDVYRKQINDAQMEWNVLNEESFISEIPPVKWARKCSITKEGMNEGWCWYSGDLYMKYEKDVKRYLRTNVDVILYELKLSDYYQQADCVPLNHWNEVIGLVKGGVSLTDDDLLTIAYGLDMVYWTEWQDEDDMQWTELHNGILIEL